jgi:transcriptional regulator with XRE-family HTH domain
MSRQALWMIEHEESNPSLDAVGKILSGLDLTEAEFYSYLPPEQKKRPRRRGAA